ncbi:unnamed protein product, partial [Rotaria magnacalcarata]
MTCSCSYLWRIERSPPSYIFGTMHVSHERVWPYMSKEIRQAFSSSTHVYAEFNPTDDTYWDDFLQCIANRTRRVERSTDYPIRGALLDMYLIMEAHRSNKTTGHMLGKREHLIVRLKKYGYKITRICTYEKLIL